MRERWRSIPGYDGRYEISTNGEVRSWNGHNRFREGASPRASEPRMLKPKKRWRKRGGPELLVTLYDRANKPNQVRVKALMRDVWMDGPKAGYVIHHKNWDQLDCSLHNLRYATQAEINASMTSGRRKPVVAREVATGEILDVWPSICIAAKKNFLTRNGMAKRIYRKTICEGIVFEFEL